MPLSHHHFYHFYHVYFVLPTSYTPLRAPSLQSRRWHVACKLYPESYLFRLFCPESGKACMGDGLVLLYSVDVFGVDYDQSTPYTLQRLFPFLQL